MKSAIFIPTSNRINALKECLDSLRIQTRQDFRVLLGGIQEDQQVSALIRQYPELEMDYFIQKKKGIIGAANEALERVNEEIFIRIDDDVVLAPAWFEYVMATFEQDEKVGGVTGPTIMSDLGIQSRDLTAFLDRFSKSRNWLLRAVGKIYTDYIYEQKLSQVGRFLRSGAFTPGSNYPGCEKIEQPIEVDYLEACNWSARTQLLREIGGYDEIYLKGLGDYHEADSSMSIRKLGYRLIFHPKAKLKHNVEQGNVGNARPAAFYRIQNFFIFYGRHIGFQTAGHFFRFWTNVALQNLYYIYKFLTTGKINQLAVVPGTFVGLLRYLVTKRK